MHEQIVRFPLNRRVGKVRSVAHTLAVRRTEVGRARYWGRVVEQLSRELRRHGAGEAEVQRELSAFQRVVGEELELLDARCG